MNTDLAALDQMPEEEAPSNYKLRRPASIGSNGGMSVMQSRCGVFAAPDESSEKYSSLQGGRELWIKPASEGWVEVQRKTGAAYMKADCF